MRFRTGIVSGLMVLLSAQAVAAQAWDSPSFAPPGQRNNLGLYLVDPDGSDIGVMGLWRRSGPTTTLGLRAGVFEFDDARFAVGADLSRMLVSSGPDVPVDIAGTLGLGATFGDGTFARVPVGLSVGRRFAADTWQFLPYVHPRVGLDIASNGSTDTDVSFTTDVGADLHVGRAVMLRLGVALGDHSGIGFGVALTGAALGRVAGR